MPAELAERVHSLPPLARIPGEDLRELFSSMVDNDFLEFTEEGGIITGLAGEKLLSSFKFYAVFKDSEDFTVRCDSDEIGTISAPPPVGDRFALAGRVWEVKELDISRRLIYVERVEGKMEISWPGDYGEIDTAILKRMRKVLSEDTVYPYLKPNAAARSSASAGAHTASSPGSELALSGRSASISPGTRRRSGSAESNTKAAASSPSRWNVPTPPGLPRDWQELPLRTE
jgi:ATP-dependent Lhr-like helicase